MVWTPHSTCSWSFQKLPAASSPSPSPPSSTSMQQTLSLCTSQTSTLVSHKTSECDSVVCCGSKCTYCQRLQCLGSCMCSDDSDAVVVRKAQRRIQFTYTSKAVSLYSPTSPSSHHSLQLHPHIHTSVTKGRHVGAFSAFCNACS